MKSPKPILLILASILVFLPLLYSCSSTQMAALPCPEPVKNNNLKKTYKKNVNQKYFARNKPSGNKKSSSLIVKNSRTKTTGKGTSLATQASIGNRDIIERSYSEAPDMIESQNGPYIEYDYRLVRNDNITISGAFSGQNYRDNTLPVYIPAECDTIILKSGKMVLGKVGEIGAYEIRYRRCDNLDGPVIVVRKAELAEIRYQNGSKEIFTDTEQKVNQMPYPQAFNPGIDQRRVEGLGLAGFIASLVGLFIAGIPLGIIAMIFGLVSLSKIKKQPGRFKGRGFAIASFIIGLVDVLAMIVLLAMAV